MSSRLRTSSRAVAGHVGSGRRPNVGSLRMWLSMSRRMWGRRHLTPAMQTTVQSPSRPKFPVPANCAAGGSAPAMQSPPQAPKSARFPITENACVSPSLCRARDTLRKPPTIMAADCGFVLPDQLPIARHPCNLSGRLSKTRRRAGNDARRGGSRSVRSIPDNWSFLTRAV
jgi:hypothetical protein